MSNLKKEELLLMIIISVRRITFQKEQMSRFEKNDSEGAQLNSLKFLSLESKLKLLKKKVNFNTENTNKFIASINEKELKLVMADFFIWKYYMGKELGTLNMVKSYKELKKCTLGQALFAISDFQAENESYFSKN